jgi:Arc/MetJ-type ribon-helix-helix transcriptional regulator
MVDSIVSVRMPSSLVQELRSLSKEKHFLDVSEEIRSIIRIKTHEYNLKIGDKKAEQTERKTTKLKQDSAVKEELVKRLKEMIKELENGN